MGDAQAHPCGLGYAGSGKAPRYTMLTLSIMEDWRACAGGWEPFPGRGMAVGCMVRLSQQLSWPPRLSSTNCRRLSSTAGRGRGAMQICAAPTRHRSAALRRPGPPWPVKGRAPKSYLPLGTLGLMPLAVSVPVLVFRCHPANLTRPDRGPTVSAESIAP